MGNFQVTYKPFGESAILIEWPQKISKEILKDIQIFIYKIENYSGKELIEYNFIYNSLLVTYDLRITHYSEIKMKLELLYSEEFHSKKVKKSVWHFPVCYAEEFGIDLAFLSSQKKMSIEEIISRHSSTNYTVYGIGFLPGFLYLGGLSEKLHCPRRNIPRLQVPKGVVGIGGNQTGIYPQNSPGGWHIIGKTPISLFNVKNEIPCVISPGDEIRFFTIAKDEFDIIEKEYEQGIYELKKNVLDD
ncbi:MAG: 5-oxoprolinase subunit PxpB [Lutibacter sp.]|nr:5-oxoprolinase subunit PxpB [Lutibacter sp.]